MDCNIPTGGVRFRIVDVAAVDPLLEPRYYPRMLKKSLSGMVSPLRWNLKRLPGSDFVRIAEHVAISIENLHIFADIYSPALRYSSFADLGEAIPRLYCVRALMATNGSRSPTRRRCPRGISGSQ